MSNLPLDFAGYSQNDTTDSSSYPINTPSADAPPAGVPVTSTLPDISQDNSSFALPNEQLNYSSTPIQPQNYAIPNVGQADYSQINFGSQIDVNQPDQSQTGFSYTDFNSLAGNQGNYSDVPYQNSLPQAPSSGTVDYQAIIDAYNASQPVASSPTPSYLDSSQTSTDQTSPTPSDHYADLTKGI